ncbi:fimbrial protein [Enterobacter asburiae]|nr:fimbrial protein [Enterobacter asburiae]
MKLKHNYLLKGVQTLTLLVLSLVAQPLWAACSFTHGTSSGLLLFTVPPIIVPEDTPVGTVLYSGQVSSASVRVKCTSKGDIYQGYDQVNDSDYQANNPLQGVYASNVPGIGVRATWVNSGTASFSGGSYIKPYGMGTSKVGDTSYNLLFNAIVELVVTGPVSSGDLTTRKFQANWVYDNITVATLAINSTTVNVTANSCDLVEKDLIVEMRPVSTGDFVFGAATGVTNDPFYIQLVNCSAGLAVDFKFSSSGSSGLVDNFTLATIPGSDAAEGVGIQIVGINKTLMEFNKAYTVSANTSEGQSFRIPFTARYTQTGDITPGLVNAIATFEINYR